MRTKSVVLESIHGLMGANTKANGSTTIWKAWESTYGTMAVCTKVNTKTTRNMVLEFTRGLIRDAMRATGLKESSMAWALT